MYVLVDHRDSFTYNLAQLVGALGAEVHVMDAPAAGVVPRLPDGARGVILSPGPGHPDGAVGSLQWVRALLGRVPLLGVCLGHQILCRALGASVERARTPVHGRARALHHEGRGLFRGLPSPLMVARYHSWVVSDHGLPPALRVRARDDEGQIMAVAHREHFALGVQFHPESFLTPEGQALVAAFLRGAEQGTFRAPRDGSIPPGEVVHG